MTAGSDPTYYDLDPADADGATDGRSLSWTVTAHPNTVGPWDPRFQHAGPPSALAVLAAESALTAATGREDLTALRFSAELARPVPVATLQVRAEVERTGRTSAAVAVHLLDDAGRACLAARVLFLAGSDTVAVASAAEPVAGGAPESYPPMPHGGFGYGDSIEWRSISGGLLEPGPGRVWTRPRVAIVAGREPSALQRAVLVGDSASGVSAELDWGRWSFVNADLDVHLLRPVEGEWILLDARTRIGPSGAGLAASTLHDAQGLVGTTTQLLAVSPRSR